MAKIGIIGGTGIDSPEILQNREIKELHTEFGTPASKIITGVVQGVEVAILSRHGENHQFNPTNVPYRANIAAFKQLGCTHILAGSAVGSLKEDVRPGQMVFTNQFIDRTTKRIQTFYNKDKVCHISVAEPFCNELRRILAETASELGLDFHKSGTCIAMEGPRFSTKAESTLYQSWNADIINMTLVPECILAREAEIAYANIAMVTDYDVWKEDHVVSNEAVVETMKQNVDKLKRLLLAVIPKIANLENSAAGALKGAMF